MQEYTINVKEDGSAVVARDKWNKDRSMKAMREKPFIFEVGQRVVDIFSNVVTIKEIIKNPPTKEGCCPEWNLLVEENSNCYRYTEIAGIYVCDLTADELNALIVKKESKCEMFVDTADVGSDKTVNALIDLQNKGVVICV